MVRMICFYFKWVNFVLVLSWCHFLWIIHELKSYCHFTQIIQINLYCHVASTGNIMGSVVDTVLRGLDRILRIPRGCGEQTMYSLGPNVYVYKYLKHIKKFTGELEESAEQFIGDGECRTLLMFLCWLSVYIESSCVLWGNLSILSDRFSRSFWANS